MEVVDIADRIFGPISGVAAGQTFPSRRALSDAGVHRPLQAGICGTGATGAESIVVSGGYVDDVDHGDEIVYTGHGGQDGSGRQVEDQRVDAPGNAALYTSWVNGVPVRVVRGVPGATASARKTYRYDGLFVVTDHWTETGKDGFVICRYRLKTADAVAATSEVAEESGDDLPLPTGERRPGRRISNTERLVRSRILAEEVKRRHNFECQVCGLRIETPAGGLYAEAAHIKPVGRPHDGPDEPENMLVLCPNHHRMFDLGVIQVEEDRTVIDVVRGRAIATLGEVKGHSVDSDFLAYHRETHTAPPSASSA